MNTPIDKDGAVAIATERVLDDAVDRLEHHVIEVTEEGEGWWIRWRPPEGWLGGGPNVFVSKSDGTIQELYYTQ